MVSRSKRNSAPAAFVHANATAANVPSQQKPADEQKLPSITSRSRRNSGRFVSGEAAEPAKFLVTLLEQFINRDLGYLREVPAQRAAQILRSRIIVAMCSAFRLGDTLID